MFSWIFCEEELFDPFKLIEGLEEKMEQDYYVRIFSSLGSVKPFVSFGPLEFVILLHLGSLVTY